jgi:lipopolysaccharide heptosyltransferase II
MTWAATKNVLCIRLDYLGDVLMTTPALHAVRRGAPDRRLTLLTSPGAAAVTRYIPDIDETIVYSAPWLKHGYESPPDRDFEMIERLRAARFDAAIIFTVFSQNPLPATMMCYLAGIPLRLAHCHENPYRLLTDWIKDPEPSEMIRHEVQRQLDLVGSVGFHADDQQMRFAVPEQDVAWVGRHLHRLGIDTERPWMVLHPGASAASRRYPGPLWAQAVQRIAKHIDCAFVFTGSSEEAGLIESIRGAIKGVKTFSLAGELDLGQLGALIARAPLVISNNTGPAHLAAAVGTPVVDLYALTNPQHTPWMVPNRVLYHDVPCRFCFKSICPQGHNDCLTKVTPEQVANAALELLERPSPSDTTCLLRHPSRMPNSVCTKIQLPKV